MYYFAYGSNLNQSQMAYRCPGAHAVGPAELDGYKLVERHYADIEKDCGSTVYGALYQITWSDLASLDNYEGYPTGYTRYQVEVHTPDGKVVKAWVYEMTPAKKTRLNGGHYCNSYRLTCAEGADSFGIPNAFKTEKEKEN